MDIKNRMKAGDIHISISGPGHLAIVYEYSGKQLKKYEICCDGSAGPGWTQHNGDTPPGLYVLGTPVWTQDRDDYHTIKAPFGPVFVPLDFIEGPPGAAARQGLGDHGGGSGLEDPMASRQGWVVTHGCVRHQNEDVIWVANLQMAKAKVGNKIYQTVAW